MTTTELPKKQNTILKWIAQNGPATEYQLTKEKSLGLSSFVAHQATGQLAEKGLLSTQTKGKARTGKTIKQYKLTLNGFLEVTKEKEAWEKMDQIIAANVELLPEYFGLWGKFKQAKVDDIAYTLLSYTLERLKRGVPSFPERIDGRKPTVRDWLPRLAIYPWEAYADNFLTQKEAAAFLFVILADENAEKLYVSTLQWLIDAHRSTMQSFENVLQKYKELKQQPIVGRRYIDVLTSDKTPLEKLQTLREDPELWEVLVQNYPEMKDAKDANEIAMKLKCIIDSNKRN